MSREIKFRGISRDTEKFVYGMLMYSVSDSGLVIVETVNIPPSMQDPCGDTINIYHGIKQGTESQFTGLQDKNGVDDYHKNILKDTLTGLIVTVEYGEYNCTTSIGYGWYLQKTNGSVYTSYPRNLDGWEIVGNTHQNPELLKESK